MKNYLTPGCYKPYYFLRVEDSNDDPWSGVIISYLTEDEHNSKTGRLSNFCYEEFSDMKLTQKYDLEKVAFGYRTKSGISHSMLDWIALNILGRWTIISAQGSKVVPKVQFGFENENEAIAFQLVF